MRFLLCTLTLCLLLFGINALAQSNNIGLGIQKISISDSTGSKFKLVLTSYKNHLDELEIRLTTDNLPRINSKTNPTIGFGRDTDNNNKIDTWFFISKNGIDSLIKEGQDSLGLDVLPELLKTHYRSTFMMHINSLTTSLLSYLLMSVDEAQQVDEKYYRDWMDLEELKNSYEKNRAELKFSYSREQLQLEYEILSTGYRDLADTTEKFIKQNFWGYAAADVALWATGAIVIKWIGKIFIKLGVSLTENVLFNSIKENLLSFFNKQKIKIDNKMASLSEAHNKAKINLGMKVAEKELMLVISAATWRTAMLHSIKASKTKSIIYNSVKWPIDVMMAGISNWKYIGVNVGIQLSSEAYVRFKDIYDTDPQIMVKNLMTNPEVIQNVSYMTTNTLLMSGVTTKLKSVKAGYFASAGIALTNSSITNFYIKDTHDYKRVAVDTAWESIIGSGQVMLDLKSLAYFEKMAIKKNNPKLKLIGYSIVLVDSIAGYVTYSKLSSSLHDEAPAKESLKPMLVPIMADMTGFEY